MIGTKSIIGYLLKDFYKVLSPHELTTLVNYEYDLPRMRCTYN